MAFEHRFVCICDPLIGMGISNDTFLEDSTVVCVLAVCRK